MLHLVSTDTKIFYFFSIHHHQDSLRFLVLACHSPIIISYSFLVFIILLYIFSPFPFLIYLFSIPLSYFCIECFWFSYFYCISKSFQSLNSITKTYSNTTVFSVSIYISKTGLFTTKKLWNVFYLYYRHAKLLVLTCEGKQKIGSIWIEKWISYNMKVLYFSIVTFE